MNELERLLEESKIIFLYDNKQSTSIEATACIILDSKTLVIEKAEQLKSQLQQTIKDAEIVKKWRCQGGLPEIIHNQEQQIQQLQKEKELLTENVADFHAVKHERDTLKEAIKQINWQEVIDDISIANQKEEGFRHVETFRKLKKIKELLEAPSND